MIIEQCNKSISHAYGMWKSQFLQAMMVNEKYYLSSSDPYSFFMKLARFKWM